MALRGRVCAVSQPFVAGKGLPLKRISPDYFLPVRGRPRNCVPPTGPHQTGAIETYPTACSCQRAASALCPVRSLDFSKRAVSVLCLSHLLRVVCASQDSHPAMRLHVRVCLRLFVTSAQPCPGDLPRCCIAHCSCNATAALAHVSHTRIHGYLYLYMYMGICICIDIWVSVYVGVYGYHKPEITMTTARHMVLPIHSRMCMGCSHEVAMDTNPNCTRTCEKR